MPHLAPLNWFTIYLLANLHLIFTLIPLWWTINPSYSIPKIKLKLRSFHLF